jgi:hypothetical protein
MRVVSANPDLPDRAVDILHACTVSECQAIQRLLEGSEKLSSSSMCSIVFDAVPAGIFVKLVGDAVRRVESNQERLRPNCVRLLAASKDYVLAAITSPCRCTEYDPRPALAEAWLAAMVELARATAARIMLNDENGDSMMIPVERLLVDTCVASFSLLFSPTMGKTEVERSSDPGMSLDGPQSIELTTFLALFFQLGPSALESVAQGLTNLISIDMGSAMMTTTMIHDSSSSDPSIHGASIIGAALFRASQGAFPPWAIEFTPDVYSSLFVALGKNVDRFRLVLRISMDVRLSSSPPGCRFGSVEAGQLLSGRYFEGMSDTTKNDFVNQAAALAEQDDTAAWKRLKVIIKQACGGKKKDTDFGQKPSLTRWDFTRL